MYEDLKSALRLMLNSAKDAHTLRIIILSLSMQLKLHCLTWSPFEESPGKYALDLFGQEFPTSTGYLQVLVALAGTIYSTMELTLEDPDRMSFFNDEDRKELARILGIFQEWKTQYIRCSGATIGTIEFFRLVNWTSLNEKFLALQPAAT
ncbi:MAG TPA: hypothetical protein VLE72_03690 [Candidatus Saccharimonadales bacterium]|nr:hypothetical protein [Candidatus Saccharimonadales bacterium]